jgi:hypothetical protein
VFLDCPTDALRQVGLNERGGASHPNLNEMEIDEMKLDWDAIDFVVDGIIFHIQNGGWINDDWPNHIIGASRLNAEEREAALQSADYRYWSDEGMSVTLASKINLQREIDDE